jgi:homospermidine synthase
MTTKFVPQKGPPKTWAICTFTAGYQAKPHRNWREEAIHLFNLPKKKKKKKRKRKRKNKGKKLGQQMRRTTWVLTASFKSLVTTPSGEELGIGGFVTVQREGDGRKDIGYQPINRHCLSLSSALGGSLVRASLQ